MDSGSEPTRQPVGRDPAAHTQQPTRLDTPTDDLPALAERAHRPGDPLLRQGPMPDDVGNHPRTAAGAPSRPVLGAAVHVGVPLGRVQRAVWAVSGALVLADVVASVGAGLRVLPYALTRFFDADYKVNFPTGQKMLLLLVATILLLGCWTAARRARDPSATGWLLLALCTAFALVDETVYLHQSLAEELQHHFDFGGPLAYAWTVVYWPMAALASVFLLRNLRAMHARVRRLLLPGGILYVTGAILLEPVKSQLMERYGENSLQLKAAAAVSDSLQLIGLTLLVCSLLTAASLLTPAFTLEFGHRH